MRNHSWMGPRGLLLTVALTACATATPPQPGAQDLARVKPEWLKAYPPCNGEGVYPNDYQACLRVLVSQMEPLDPKRRGQFGEFYDPSKYYACRKGRSRGDTTCEYLALRRQENPSYWPYPSVPPIKWPDPPSQSVYRSGMSSKEYFDALCKAEAGEFISKTAKDVEGVYQIRPRHRTNDFELEDRYMLEDPYGRELSEELTPAFSYVIPDRYRFFEAAARGDRIPKYTSPKRGYDSSLESLPTTHDHVAHYSGYDARHLATMRKAFVAAPRARYGYVWRGIVRPQARELAIAGGEFAVIDLRTNEILGLKRGFIRSGMAPTRSHIRWDVGQLCPGDSVRPDRFHQFVLRVLKPKSN